MDVILDDDGCFERPRAVPKQVWGRYGTFRIEDLPDSRREDAIKYLRENYLLEEPLSSVMNKTNPYTESDIRTYFNHYMDYNLSLIAVDEANNDEIAGATILRVVSKCKPLKHVEFDSQFKSYQELLDFMFYCFDGINTFSYEYGTCKIAVDHVLESVGLSVSAKYRGKGIGEALIKARHKLAATIGLGATCCFYTSIYSQALILRQPGMKVLKEVFYSDYKVDGKAKFAELNPPHPSAMVIGGSITEDMAWK